MLLLQLRLVVSFFFVLSPLFQSILLSSYVDQLLGLFCSSCGLHRVPHARSLQSNVIFPALAACRHIALTARICPCSRLAYLRCSVGVPCKAAAAVVTSSALNRALLARLLSDDALGIAVVDEHGVASDVEAFRGILQAHEPIYSFTPAHARSRTHSTVRMQDNYRKFSQLVAPGIPTFGMRGCTNDIAVSCTRNNIRVG